MMRDTEMQMLRGGIWDLADPKADAVDWESVAGSLAKMCRFNGHCLQFYSVAEHSIRVAIHLPYNLRLHGLLHDAHEAFTGDIHRPMKELFSPRILDIEDETDTAILRAAGLNPLGPAQASLVKEADLRMLATEVRDLMAPSPEMREALRDIEPYQERIDPLSWQAAEKAWLRDYTRHWAKLDPAHLLGEADRR